MIEVLSVCKKNETEPLSWRDKDIERSLEAKGYKLKGIKKTLLQASAIKMTLSSIAKSYNKPDIAIVTGALKSKDNSSFKKYLVESVVAA